MLPFDETGTPRGVGKAKCPCRRHNALRSTTCSEQLARWERSPLDRHRWNSGTSRAGTAISRLSRQRSRAMLPSRSRQVEAVARSPRRPALGSRRGCRENHSALGDQCPLGHDRAERRRQAVSWDNGICTRAKLPSVPPNARRRKSAALPDSLTRNEQRCRRPVVDPMEGRSFGTRGRVGRYRAHDVRDWGRGGPGADTPAHRDHPLVARRPAGVELRHVPVSDDGRRHRADSSDMTPPRASDDAPSLLLAGSGAPAAAPRPPRI